MALSMFDEIAIKMIPSLRFAVVILWLIPVIWAAPAYRRVIIRGELSFMEWVRVAISSVGVFVVGFQARAFLLGGRYYDYWTAAMLLMACIAAILCMAVAYWACAEDQHKRAMFRAHLAILLLCIIGGFL